VARHAGTAAVEFRALFVTEGAGEIPVIVDRLQPCAVFIDEAAPVDVEVLDFWFLHRVFRRNHSAVGGFEINDEILTHIAPDIALFDAIPHCGGIGMTTLDRQAPTQKS